MIYQNKSLLKTSAKKFGLQKSISYFWGTGKENEQNEQI
jgi:hypothetical protein